MVTSRHTARNRRRRAQVRRRRIGLLIVLAALVTGIALSIGSSPAGRQAAGTSSGTGTHVSPTVTAPLAVEAGLLPWQLAAPLSREVIVPSSGSPGLEILGGIDSAGSSQAGIYSLDTSNGKLTQRGSLVQATHDAAGAQLPTGAIVLGGGTAVPASTTERVTPAGNGRLAAPLPQARADAAAVTVGGTVYLVGGYAGASMDPEVLATANGKSYRPIAVLKVPVRYPAVAALGGRIYVFGGATHAGRPLAVVQVVDPQTGKARVIGHLPSPLAGAVAVTLGKTIYIAGGLTGTGTPQPTTAIFAFDLAHHAFLRAGSLQVAVANAGFAVVGGQLWIVGGETSGAVPTAAVQVVTQNRRFGLAGRPGAGSPFYGERLLIADRGNNRLLLLSDTNRITWSYPSRTKPAPRGGFYFPDDAFFIHHGSAIISNQEDNNTIVEIAFPSGRVRFQYGHPRTAGSAAGYLDSPDDAYLLRNGDITVADATNCRVLIIDPATMSVLHQIGEPGHCVHHPPYELGSPNGDTPLSNGHLLVSEINGSWIDELTRTGRVVWDVHLPIGYPSDPQQLGADRYLIADYEYPGAIVEFNRAGRIVYRYQPTTGAGVLDHPSLVELLPSGVFMLNDDYNDRVVAIDPSTGALVWQYGVTRFPGTKPSMLNTPDGFDLLTPSGATPTHSATG